MKIKNNPTIFQYLSELIAGNFSTAVGQSAEQFDLRLWAETVLLNNQNHQNRL